MTTIDTSSPHEQQQQQLQQQQQPILLPHIVLFHHPDLGLYPFPHFHRYSAIRAAKTAKLLSLTPPDVQHRIHPYFPHLASRLDLGQYHSDNYLAMLQVSENLLNGRNLNKETIDAWADHLHLFGMKIEDVFPGVFGYCRMVSSASLGGAAILTEVKDAVVINWYGGATRARKAVSSQGCLVNDAVLAILQLLKSCERVMFISLDYTHSVGVEEAFYTTNRVLKMSFHRDTTSSTQGGEGLEDDEGLVHGRGFNINIPLPGNVDDKAVYTLFVRVINQANFIYRPNAIVLSIGPSILYSDPQGDFQMTTQGFAACVRAVRDLGTPLLVLGGSGSNLADSARAFTCATLALLDCLPPYEVDFSKLDESEMELYRPSFSLMTNVDEEGRVVVALPSSNIMDTDKNVIDLDQSDEVTPDQQQQQPLKPITTSSPPDLTDLEIRTMKRLERLMAILDPLQYQQLQQLHQQQLLLQQQQQQQQQSLAMAAMMNNGMVAGGMEQYNLPPNINALMIQQQQQQQQQQQMLMQQQQHQQMMEAANMNSGMMNTNNSSYDMNSNNNNMDNPAATTTTDPTTPQQQLSDHNQPSPKNEEVNTTTTTTAMASV
jgi:histone deacetylase 1/2